jgi:hypothetical protein
LGACIWGIEPFGRGRTGPSGLSDLACLRASAKQSGAPNPSTHSAAGLQIPISPHAHTGQVRVLDASMDAVRPLASSARHLPLRPPVLPVSFCVVGRWRHAAGGAAPSPVAPHRAWDTGVGASLRVVAEALHRAPASGLPYLSFLAGTARSDFVACEKHL